MGWRYRPQLYTVNESLGRIGGIVGKWCNRGQAINIQPFLGEIALWPGIRIPDGWLPCDGRELSVETYPALFALLGTTFGGDGMNTFAIPDLRGRTPVGADPQPGSEYTLGSAGGGAEITLIEDNLPAHTHAFGATDTPGTVEPMVDAIPAKVNGTTLMYYSGAPDVAVSPLAISLPAPGGNDMPHPNMQPWLGLNAIISVNGIYPEQS